MVPPIIHTLCLGVRAAAGYSSLSSFISLKYVYSWLIAHYCTCSERDNLAAFVKVQARVLALSPPPAAGNPIDYYYLIWGK